jgi:predicted phosphodiesterase
MSRIAVISELHGNLEALQAVLAQIQKQSDVRQVYCLGDFVGYGPNPNEVVALYQSLAAKGYGIGSTIGNHDVAAIGRYEFVNLHDEAEVERVCREGNFADRLEIVKAYQKPETRRYIPVKPDAYQAMRWTIQQLSAETKAFLETQLQERIEIAPGIVAVHASPRDPVFEYVRDGKVAQKCLEARQMDGVRICFHGHTHVPKIWVLNADDRVSFGGSVVVMTEPKGHYADRMPLNPDENISLVNVGSVGQARGDDRRACFVTYDPDTSIVEYQRVAYNAAATRAKIQAAGLPDSLAGRLGGDDTDV